MWAVIGILFIAVLLVTFKAGASNASTSSVSTTGNSMDTSGWTENEVMNYEMHGTIPARAQGSAPSTSASSQMVGGC